MPDVLWYRSDLEPDDMRYVEVRTVDEVVDLSGYTGTELARTAIESLTRGVFGVLGGRNRILSFETLAEAARRWEHVRDGSRVGVAGQGLPGEAGGPAGDLYLVISVRPDPRLERRGDDLHTRIEIPLTALLLGGEARVPTPDGRTLALTIPAGTQDGRVFRLRGQGMPRPGRPEQRGDLHAEVHARLPERLSPRQRELLEELARLEAGASTGVGTR